MTRAMLHFQRLLTCTPRCAAPLAFANALICTTPARVRRCAGTAPRAASQTARAAWPALPPRRPQPFRWWCPSPSRTTRSWIPFRTSLPLLHLPAHQPLPLLSRPQALRRARLPIFRALRPRPHPRALRVHPRRRHRRARRRPSQSVLRRPQIRVWVSRVMIASVSAWPARTANAMRVKGDAIATAFVWA